MDYNRKALDEGMKKARKLIYGHLYSIMRQNVATLLHKAALNREFQGFTGNTQTSYTGGIYVDGRLVEIIRESDYTQAPIMKKVQKGRSVYLKKPYEGSPRWMRAKVRVTNEYGQDAAIGFLQSYKGAPKKGIGIVITTGTEYSAYLETVRGLDVLTKTWEQTAEIILASMRPINE